MGGGVDCIAVPVFSGDFSPEVNLLNFIAIVT